MVTYGSTNLLLTNQGLGTGEREESTTVGVPFVREVVVVAVSLPFPHTTVLVPEQTPPDDPDNPGVDVK